MFSEHTSYTIYTTKCHRIVHMYLNWDAQYVFPPGAQISFCNTFSSNNNNSYQKSEAAVMHGFKVGLSTLFVHGKGGTPERAFA